MRQPTRTWPEHRGGGTPDARAATLAGACAIVAADPSGRAAVTVVLGRGPAHDLLTPSRLAAFADRYGVQIVVIELGSHATHASVRITRAPPAVRQPDAAARPTAAARRHRWPWLPWHRHQR